MEFRARQYHLRQSVELPAWVTSTDGAHSSYDWHRRLGRRIPEVYLFSRSSQPQGPGHSQVRAAGWFLWRAYSQGYLFETSVEPP